MYLCATAVLQNKTDQQREKQWYNTQINKATTRRTHTDLLVHITLFQPERGACFDAAYVHKSGHRVVDMGIVSIFEAKNKLISASYFPVTVYGEKLVN